MGIKRLINNGVRKTPLIPKVNIPAIYKQYINILDIIVNKTNDFKSIIKEVLSLPETKQHFREIDFGKLNDPFRLLNFMETGINANEFLIETFIDKELQYRTELIEVNAEYHQLTTEDLSADQKAILNEFKQVKQNSVLADLRVKAEKSTLAGLQSEARILDSEKQVKALRKAALIEAKNFSEQTNINYPFLYEGVVKKEIHRKIKENPELSEVFYKDLKRAVSRIRPVNRNSQNRITKAPSPNGKPKKPASYSLSKIKLNKNQ